MRLSLLLLLATAACVQARPFHWPWSKGTAEHQDAQLEKKKMHFFPLPWNSRTKEQQRMTAVTQPKPTSRDEQLLHVDPTKEFNTNAMNFGSAYTQAGKKTQTGAFHFLNKTQTKSFGTKQFATKEAWGAKSKYETKSLETKQSWFARMTAPTKTYATRDSRDANKGLQGQALPGSDRKFVARGRRQAELEKSGASRVPMGGDRDMGQSWSGDLKPMSIQDVKTLLNKN